MHDLLVDLARHVTGGESIVLTTSSPSRSICPRHVNVQYEIDESWAIPAQLLNANGVRSFMFLKRSSICRATLDQLFANFRLLRTLSLSWLGLKEVPNCIGELKHLRDIDLSYNSFERLPNSMTNILNLLRLVLAGCFNLKTLPDNFSKLINLRHLNIRNCDRLTYMPPGIEEMTCLQYLSHFKVGKERQGVKSSDLVALAELQLRGELWIEFEDGIDNCDVDQCLQLPDSLQVVEIVNYPGMRIPHWTAIALTSLTLEGGSRVKCIPPSRCFPNLKKLSLCYLKELQYIEEDEDENDDIFFPSLETLVLAYLPKLKQWRRKDCITTSSSMLFLSLSQLDITDCPELKSMPVCPRVQTLDLYDVRSALVQQLSSVSSPSTDCEGITRFSDETLTSLRQLRISNCSDLKIMYLKSSHLQEISIFSCNELTSFHVEQLASLRSLVIFCCTRLKGLYISQPNVLQELKVQMCPELELWEQEKKSIDWDSFPNLPLLRVNSVPAPEMLPDCLRQRQALGKLQIFTTAE